MLNMFVRDTWYVAAWSHEIDEKIFTRKILGESICFYRKSTGDLVALEDRCPHRGAPLSMGRLEGEDIRCMYHGVRISSTGKCNDIPGQDRIPEKMCARSYPVVERHNWIWIWMGDPEKANLESIPDTWSLESPEWAYKPGYYHYQAPHMLICDNLLDFSHIAYVHPTTLGGTENIALSKPVVKAIDNKVRVERWLINEVPAPFHTNVAKFTGRVDRWHFYDFFVPGILIMHSGVQETGTGAQDGDYSNALQFRSCQAVTPESTSTSHYFFAVPRNFEVNDVAMNETIYKDVCTAFEEDRLIIEAQARRLAEVENYTMVPIAADSGLAQFRRLLRAQLQEFA